MKVHLKMLSVISASLILQMPVHAHHSANAAYQADKIVDVKGVFQKLDWINPHVLIHIQEGADKTAAGSGKLWTFEGNPPAWWRRAGFSRKELASHLGEMVTIQGNPAREGQPAGYFRQVIFADGTKLRFAQKEEGVL